MVMVMVMVMVVAVVRTMSMTVPVIRPLVTVEAAHQTPTRSSAVTRNSSPATTVTSNPPHAPQANAICCAMSERAPQDRHSSTAAIRSTSSVQPANEVSSVTIDQQNRNVSGTTWRS